MNREDGVWLANRGYAPEGFAVDRRQHLAEIEEDHFWFAPRLELIRRRLAALAPRRLENVLELGCGTGRFLPILGRTGALVSAVEGHLESARSARSRWPEAVVVHGSLYETPFPDARFDLLLALDVLEHVDPKRFLEEARRLLGPRGALLLAVPASAALWSGADARAGHRCRYDVAALRAELEENGWQLRDYTYYQCVLFPLLFASRAVNRSKLPRLERTPPRWANRLLGGVNSAEVALFGGRRLPFGSSLVASAERLDPPSAIAGGELLPDADRIPSRREEHNRYQRRYFGDTTRWRIAPVASSYVKRHLEELIVAAGLEPSDRILEVGAGMGRFTVLLKERGFDVVATDLSDKLLGDLRDRCPDLETQACDALDLPFRMKERFDKVVGFFVLHHLPDLRLGIARLARMLKPGGTMAFVEPNAFYLPFYLQITLSPRMSWKGDGGVVRMRPRAVLGGMRAAGLANLAAASYGFCPPGLTNRAGGRRAEAWLESLPLPDASKAFRIFRGELPNPER